MEEVIKKIFLAAALFAAFFSGCATKTPTSGTGQDGAAIESIAAADRIFFPGYALSISRPPGEWEMQEDLGEGELAIWLNRDGGSVIEIMVSSAVRNLSYHNIATEFNRITCDLVQQQSPSATCAIVEEKEVEFDRNKFYRVKIFYQGLMRDVSVKSLVYLLRTDTFVYHFLFMEEKLSPLADAMMASVVFHEEDQQSTAGPEKHDASSSLVDAAYYGDFETVESLLDTGVDINAPDKDGVTALSYACDRGHTDIVNILLANNAEVNTKSCIGSTPLMNAAYMGHAGIVRILISSGADVNAQSKDGTTALMNAAAHGYKEIVEILLASNADVDACEECGLNALWNAISMGHADIVKVLLDKGADVNARANDGSTALMNAAFTGNRDIVAMLLAAGAEVNAKADNGWTALMLAKRNGHAEIARLLVKAGAIQDSPREPGIFLQI